MKHTITKTTLLLMLAITLCNSKAFAQQALEQAPMIMEYALKDAPIIIEGTIIDVKKVEVVYSPKTNKDVYGISYYLYTVKPTASFKGKTNAKELYTFLTENEGFSYDENGNANPTIYPSGGGYLTSINHGIFFLSSPVPVPEVAKQYIDSKNTYVLYHNGIEYKKGKRQETIDKLKTENGLSPKWIHDEIPYPVVPVEKKKTSLIQKSLPKVQSNYAATRALLMAERAARTSTPNKTASTNDITFSFANPQQTGTTQKYFEFDIMASANSSTTFFDYGFFDMTYDSLAFGTNIFSAGNLVVTAGSGFPSASYVDPQTNTQDNSSISNYVSVIFGTDHSQASFTRNVVPTTPVQMLHFKIKLLDCTHSVDIDFAGTGFTGSFCSYSTSFNAQPSNLPDYDNVFYSNGLSNTYCTRAINYFTPTVYPGYYYPGCASNNSRLTIQGTGFGSARGNVYLTNADNGGASYLPLNYYDIKNWTDTLVEINVPSLIDSFPNHPCPGTGMFYLKTNSGDSIIKGPITMPYAISNATYTVNTYDKIRADLADINHLGGYTFYMDTSITHYNPLLVPMIKKAMKDWTCKTGINIRLSDTLKFIHASIPDGVSMIYMDPIVPIPGALAVTTPQSRYCAELGSTNTYVVVRDIDIRILRNPHSVFPSVIDWFVDTNYTASAPSKYNMFDVVLHELGHAGLLKHVNQSNDLMWYNVTAGAAANYISNDDANGGTEVVTKSTQNSYTGSCIANGTLITLVGSCSMGSSGINQYLSNNYFLNLYPNPNGGAVLNINFQAPTNSNVQIEVYDMMGRAVSSYDLNNRNEINSTYSLDVSNLSQGMYMVNLVIDKVKVCQKFIKQ